MEPGEYLERYRQVFACRGKAARSDSSADPEVYLPEGYYFENPVDSYIDNLNRSELVRLIQLLNPESEKRLTPSQWQSHVQERQKQLMAISDWASGLKEALQDKERQLKESQRELEESQRELLKLSNWAAELRGTVQLMESSLSWRITSPLRSLNRRAASLRLAITEGHPRSFFIKILRRGFYSLPLSSKSRWWLRSAAYELLGRFNPYSSRYQFYLQEKKSSRQRLESLTARHELPALPWQQSADILFWGVIDWHFRIQRPQHLAISFAEKDYRVFYFSPNLIDNSEPGFALEPLDRQGRLFCVRLNVNGAPVIYHGPPSLETIEQLRQGMIAFFDWTGTRQSISLVQHPFWFSLAKLLPNNRLIYDCMDHHDGFGNTAPELLAIEKALVSQADALVVTSQWLYDKLCSYNSNIALIRNACDYAHFSTPPETTYCDSLGRKIIGYYGAIAEWFDIELVEKTAQRFPDCLILLVGADTCRAGDKLARFSNVTLTGEVNYERLPQYLYAMDVCIIPFKVIPLTLATNPVKAYEYLSAGKPVIAVDLPELHSFEGNIKTSASHDHFLKLLDEELSKEQSGQAQASRKAFAAQQTWQQRIKTLEASIQSLKDPLVSLIVVTYNNLELTQACLESLTLYSDYSNYEVIIVDNASSDETPAYLSDFSAARTNFKVILNPENRGFSAANNQGLLECSGDYIVFLNNDTVVTAGWIRTLLAHFKRDPQIGLLGPITNNIGNEARVITRYSNLDEMHKEARAITLSNMGRSFDIPTLAFFCVMLPRRVYSQAGLLDESFGIGFFEDDDYCRRIEKLGYRIVCAEDVFIHHHLSAAFDKIDQQARRALFEKNKKLYEKKWGEWIPHRYR